jgi:acyl-CoA thioester hydrolase
MPEVDARLRSMQAPRIDDHDPARPSFVAYVRVRFSDLDGLGHANNAAYVNFLEQAAIDHAAALDLGQGRQAAFGGVFIVRRHVIEYLQPAVAGDRLRVLTWIDEMRGARAVRSYEVRRQSSDVDLVWPLPDRTLRPHEVPPEFGDVILRARTDWAFVDIVSGRPRRMPAEMLAIIEAAADPSR